MSQDPASEVPYVDSASGCLGRRPASPAGRPGSRRWSLRRGLVGEPEVPPRLEQHAPVVEHVSHTDGVVEPDRGLVLGAYEQADARHLAEEQADQVAQAATAVP